jgi:hypothetical protein
MDFLDPKKKRSHQIRLFIGYGLVAIALTIATLILVFAANGYDIDRDTGTVIQNGLVILDAHPESATILVNGAEKGTTDNRLVLPADKYTIELARKGYLSWKHDINLEGSSIEQLVYPFLYPEKLVTKDIQAYNGQPSLASESPDRHWLVVANPETSGNFFVVDLSTNKHPLLSINLPKDTLTPASGAQSFEAIEWSTDNNHLLLKHAFSGGTEFIMLDRDKPANSVNLNKVFTAQAFTDISLRDKKADQFYLHNQTDGNLFVADSKARTVTLLKAGVVSYKSYEDNTVLYATHPADKDTAEVRIHQKDQDYAVRTLPKADRYMLDMAKFNGHFYLVTGSKTDGHAYVYKDPFDDLTHKPARVPQPFRVLITPGGEYVSFSAIARFIALQGGSAFAVYDAETGRLFRYDTKLALPAGQKATWMDGHRLLLNSSNAVQVFDFDGTNMHQLSAESPAYIPFFDRDYTALFTLSPNTDAAKTNLVRTELKVLPEGSNN